jgi:hypothetical protein
MRRAPKRSVSRPAGTGQSGHQRSDRHDEPDQRGFQRRAHGQIEGTDHQRRHHHRRDERTHREACPQHRDRGTSPAGSRATRPWSGRLRRGRRRRAAASSARFSGPNCRAPPSWPAHRPPASGPAAACPRVEARRASAFRAIGGQETARQSSVTTPSGTLTRNIARQPRGQAISTPPSDGPAPCRSPTSCRAAPWRCRSFLWHRLADEGHGQRQHDGRAQALRRAGGDQQPSVGASPHSTEASVNRPCRSAAGVGGRAVAQPAGADDQLVMASR